MQKHKQYIFSLGSIVLAVFFCVSPLCAADWVIGNIDLFSKDDRVLILAPHPDDETLGCAGIIQRAVKSGAPVKIAYLTNGEFNQLANIVYEKKLTLRQKEFVTMGEVRSREARKAMRLLGVPEQDLIFLGYPDFGTFAIWTKYWNGHKPFKTMLTRISAVPYKENRSFGASYTGESILNDIEAVLEDFKPTKIFVTNPADTNGDHDTLYLFLQVALNDLRGRIPDARVYTYLIHCKEWPLPRRYHPELSLIPPEKYAGSSMKWCQLSLSAEEIEQKYQALQCYKSQVEVSAAYLYSFVRQNELFSEYPDIGLTEYTAPQEPDASLVQQDGGRQEHPKAAPDGVVFSVVNSDLLIRIEKPREHNDRLGIVMYIFGYNNSTPFSLMPKLHIVSRGNALNVFEGKKISVPEGVSLRKGHNEVVFRIPLHVLGDPDFLLTSIRVSGEFLPVDFTAFRRVRIRAPH